MFYSSPGFNTSIHTEWREVYKPIPGNKNITKYEEIANRRFLIKDIGEKKGYGAYCFTLQEIVNNDTSKTPHENYGNLIYMIYQTPNYNKPYFITEGYVEKLKNTFEGNEYIWSARNFIKSMETGEDICPPAGTVFKCIEIALVNGRVEAILQNEKYGKCVGDLNQVKGQIFCFHNYKDY